MFLKMILKKDCFASLETTSFCACLCEERCVCSSPLSLRGAVRRSNLALTLIMQRFQRLTTILCYQYISYVK